MKSRGESATLEYVSNVPCVLGLNVQSTTPFRNCTTKRKRIPTLKSSGPQGATLWTKISWKPPIKPGYTFLVYLTIGSIYRGCLHSRCLWCHAQNSCPPVGGDLGDYVGRLFWGPMRISDIKWNFEKFFVGPDGKPVMRWHPSIEVSEVRADIYKYLRDKKILD